MGNKIFVSYKYGDQDVAPLKDAMPERYSPTTVRHYVDELQDLLSFGDHINKGENDNESLDGFKDSTIASKLRDKIFDSSITIVMVSPNMKDPNVPEGDQWIPWEISYSLKEHSRNGRTSQANAIIAVVLPDRSNSYEYFMQAHNCCAGGCTTIHRQKTFAILGQNMFNPASPAYKGCGQGKTIFTGDYSYITSVRWDLFTDNMDHYLNNAIRLNDKIHEFEIIKTV